MNTHIDVGMKCIKYMLFVSNFMFLMVGALLISFGSTIKAIYHAFELFMEDHYFSPATLVIAVGVIVMLISVFGCAAAFKESTCMVNVFAWLLIISLILEISASIAAYAMRGNIKFLMKEKMETTMHDYSSDEVSMEAMDFLQERLGCCGIMSKDDWTGDFLVNNHTSLYPESCCRTNLNSRCIPSTHGCLDRLTFIISESAVMLGTGALCIAFIQVLGIVFAIMLAKSIRRLKTQQAAARWQTRQELYLQLARGNDKTNPTPVIYTANGTQVDP